MSVSAREKIKIKCEAVRIHENKFIQSTEIQIPHSGIYAPFDSILFISRIFFLFTLEFASLILDAREQWKFSR